MKLKKLTDVVKTMKKKVEDEIEERMEKDASKVEYVAKTMYAMRLKENLKSMQKDKNYSNAVLDVKFSELKRDVKILTSKLERGQN